MKALLKTTGEFELHDLDAKQAVLSTRPCVVTVTPFIGQRMALGQLRSLKDLPDSATDEAFAGYWAEAKNGEGVLDANLAIESFLASLDADEKA